MRMLSNGTQILHKGSLLCVLFAVKTAAKCPLNSGHLDLSVSAVPAPGEQED